MSETPISVCLIAIALTVTAAAPGTATAQKPQSDVLWSELFDAEKIKNALIEHSANGDLKAVAALLEQGTEPDSTDSDGHTALHWAAHFKHVDVMRLLIEHGADVNATTASGESVLHEAAGALTPEPVRILLDAGVKPDDDALAWACWLRRIENAKLLLDAGARPDAGLPNAAASHNTALVQMLLERGADPNSRSRAGYTALHNAVNVPTVKRLLEAGANPNARDNPTCETPLFNLASHKDLEMVKLLVRAGARLDLPNKEGITPVRWAAIRGTQEIYQWLLEAAGGAEPRFVRSDVLAPLFPDKSSQELVAAYTAASRRTHCLELQPELVLRGREIVPLVLESIAAGAPIEEFYPLFEAMGPDAAEALPTIVEQLGKKDHVFMAATTLEKMKPGALEDLPGETNEQMATALHDAILSEKEPILAGMCLAMLVRMGDSAATTILRFLQHADAEYRGYTARKIAHAPAQCQFNDKRIETELVKMTQDDKDPLVRIAAASAIGTCSNPSQTTRDALLGIMRNPPEEHSQDGVSHSGRHDWRATAEAAGRSLVRFGPEAIEDLIPLLSPMSAPTRLPAITALQAINEPAVPRLVELLAAEDRAVAISASVALNKIGRPARATLPSLLEMAASETHTDHARLAAASIAMKIAPDAARESEAILSAIPALIRVLDKGGFRLQGEAAETLGAIGPLAVDALPALRQRTALPDDNEDTEGLVRDYVSRAAKAAILAIQPDGETTER